ncbi:MAG: glycosyltransferase family 9 protein [Oscillochloris sp.]|nr:glycosyltransferase family 9 protein [Oscillochloris sp.]
MRRAHYDAALILRDDHWWGAALAAVAGIPWRIGHAHPLCEPFLSRALPYHPQEHVTQQALALVRQLAPAPQSDRPQLRFVPTLAEARWAENWMAQHLAPNERLIVIHPGTGGPSKHWLEEDWATVGNALAKYQGLRLLLTGGPAEVALVERIAARMPTPPLTLAGATSVGQLTALLGHATLVLGVDSGPLHLAVSQGVPTIHLFGPSDERRFGPWGPAEQQIVLRTLLPCTPCGVFSHCPRHTEPVECMAAITPQAVIAAVKGVIPAEAG